MFRRLGLILLLTNFILISGFAQSYTPKQILDYWEHDSEKSTSKYVGIAKYLEYGLPDSAKADYKELADLMGENPAPKIQLYYQLSKLLTESHYGEAVTKSLLNKTLALLPIAAATNSKYALAWYFRFLGQMCFKQGDLERAVYYLRLSVNLHEETGISSYDNDTFSGIYYALGKALYQTGDYGNSVIYSQKALKFLDAIKKNTEPEFYIKSFILLRDLVGASNKKYGKYKDAKESYQKIIEAIKNNDLQSDPYYSFWEGLTYGNIGQVYLEEGQLNDALPLLETGLKTCLKFNDHANSCEFYTNIAEVNYLRGNDKKAIEYGLKAENDLESLVYKAKVASNVYRILYNSSQRLGKSSEAIKYLKLYKENLKADQKLAESSKLKRVEVELNFNRLKEQNKERLSKITELRRTRNTLIISLIVLIIFAIIFYYQNLTKQRKKDKISALNQELKEKDINAAKREISIFKESILEKEKLILELEAKADSFLKIEKNIYRSLRESTLITEMAWVNFKDNFIKAYPNFLITLRSKHIGLTPTEERLAMLIFLKLDNTELSFALGISKESVGKSKRRLRATLGFNANDELEQYLINLG